MLLELKDRILFQMKVFIFTEKMILSYSGVSVFICIITLSNLNAVLCRDHSLTSTDYSKTVQVRNIT